jgi:hypothetical protein
MATTETILSIGECVATYHVTEYLVRAYIKAGKLRAWRDERGRWCVPQTAAERCLGAYRDALTPETAAAVAGITPGGISQATKTGALQRIPPPNADAKKAGVYIRPADLEAWLHSRRGAAQKAARAARAAKTNEPTQPPLPVDAPPTTAAGPNLEASTLLAEVRALGDEVAALREMLGVLASSQKTMAEGLLTQTTALTAHATATGRLADWVGELAVLKASEVQPAWSAPKP